MHSAGKIARAFFAHGHGALDPRPHWGTAGHLATGVPVRQRSLA